jgi:hypothetical protein
MHASRLAITKAYHLRPAALARRAHDIVGARRHDLAHVVVAYLVLLRIVFYLWWGQPRQCSTESRALYLGMVRVLRAIAVHRRRVDSSRIWAGRGLQVVRGIRRPWRVH